MASQIPPWLRKKLREVPITDERIDEMTPEEAMGVLEEHWSRPR
ncbi:MAG: hypothetical protein ACRDWE_03380 [Acidimicrobiales bacterium]